MTITVLSKRIRDALAAAPDGMTASELSFALDISASQISRSLALMPDVYIDRWEKSRSKYAGVHCLAFVPDDCPHP
jgi:DNA-binding transcriptional regulator GbsR (MarR family)